MIGFIRVADIPRLLIALAIAVVLMFVFFVVAYPLMENPGVGKRIPEWLFVVVYFLIAAVSFKAGDSIWQRVRPVAPLPFEVAPKGVDRTTRSGQTWRMTQTRTIALRHLYSLFTDVAESMGGTVSQRFVTRGVPSIMTAGRQAENVPALHAEMLDDFLVEVAPSDAVSFGTAFSVTAKRLHAGMRKSDWTFTYGPDGWKMAGNPLSEERIRACLTPEGPRPT